MSEQLRLQAMQQYVKPSRTKLGMVSLKHSKVSATKWYLSFRWAACQVTVAHQRSWNTPWPDWPWMESTSSLWSMAVLLTSRQLAATILFCFQDIHFEKCNLLCVSVKIYFSPSPDFCHSCSQLQPAQPGGGGGHQCCGAGRKHSPVHRAAQRGDQAAAIRTGSRSGSAAGYGSAPSAATLCLAGGGFSQLEPHHCRHRPGHWPPSQMWGPEAVSGAPRCSDQKVENSVVCYLLFKHDIHCLCVGGKYISFCASATLKYDSSIVTVLVVSDDVIGYFFHLFNLL